MLYSCYNYFSNSQGQKHRLEMFPIFRMDAQGPFYQDNANNLQELREIITIDKAQSCFYSKLFFCSQKL
jgi:hypothetical protein